MRTTRTAALATLTAMGLALAACGAETTNDTVVGTGMDNAVTEVTDEMAPRTATAMLRDAQGNEIGSATATAVGEQVEIALTARNLEAGTRGVHVHTTGQCDAPGFTTAGGHWNPTGAQHGSENPQGAHAGDMPNLTVAADGTASATFTLPAGNFDGLMDADGSAIVIHAGADDLRTDPAGDSGDRIACGVFAAG